MRSLLNRIAFLIAFGLLFLQAAKAQSFVWAQAINGVNPIRWTGLSSVTTDTAGNTYITGYFGSTVDFDPSAGVYNLTAVSQADMFIMKKDPLGNLIWVKQVKGLSSGVGSCAGSGEVDSAGNILIMGGFADSFDFDPGPAVYKLNSNGDYHVFILKLDSAGAFVWVKDIGYQFPSTSLKGGNEKRAKNGDLYFALEMNGDGITPLDVDPGPAVYNIAPDTGDLILQKLDSNGNFIWAKLITGDNVKHPRVLEIDSASNLFVAGNLLGSADFDPGPGVHTLTNTPPAPNFSGGYDIFVAKYDSMGNFSWAHSFGSGFDDDVSGGAVDRFGNVLVSGSFGDTVDFDPGPSVYNVTTNSTRSLYTLRLKNNGDFSWANTPYASGGVTYGGVVATDDAGNVYTAASLGSSYVSVQKLDSAGNYVWATYFEGNVPGWIGLDNKDSVYITGIFIGANKDFDPGPGVYPLSGGGGNIYASFIVKLNQTLLPTGVADASLQTAAVSVYPNPSSGIVMFSAPTAIHHMEITDLMGKVVYRAEPAQMKTEIDLSGKAAGIYFYEVDCGAGKQRGKLVKE